MILKLRKQHVLWWVFLAIVLPVLIVLSIIFRPDFPREDADFNGADQINTTH